MSLSPYWHLTFLFAQALQQGRSPVHLTRRSVRHQLSHLNQRAGSAKPLHFQHPSRWRLDYMLYLDERDGVIDGGEH